MRLKDFLNVLSVFEVEVVDEIRVGYGKRFVSSVIFYDKRDTVIEKSDGGNFFGIQGVDQLGLFEILGVHFRSPFFFVD